MEDQEHGVFMHKTVLLRLTMLPDGWCSSGLAALTFELRIMSAALLCFLDAMASVADGLLLLVVLVAYMSRKIRQKANAVKPLRMLPTGRTR